MSLLKYLFIFIVISWILRILFKLFIYKVSKNFREQYNPYQQTNNPYQSKPEGKVNVDFMPKKKIKDPGGDFIDFEEVK